MVEETLDIIVNARDYASAALRGVTVYLRELGVASLMVTSNVAMLTRELGLEVPILNEAIRAFRIVGVTVRLAGAAMKVYKLLTHSATAATVAHTIAQHGLNAALAVTVGLLTVGVGLGLAAAVYGAFKGVVPSMEFGGFVSRGGVYYLHPGEIGVPRPSVVAGGGSTRQTINVYFENRAPISSEVDEERLLRDLGKVVAEKARRSGYH